MKSNKIFYNGMYEGNLNISPSKKHIPGWYKDIKAYNNSNIEFIEDNPVKSLKSCIPFLDSLTSGYMVELWSDIHCKKQNGSHIVTYAANNPVGVRNVKSLSKSTIPSGHSEQEYTWISPFFIKLPKGYSALVTHPLNRFDLPFTTISGIFDGFLAEGNIPFFIKDDFEGVIESGTPIFQILPFKTENWEIEKNKDLKNDSYDYASKVKQKFFGYYKNNIWTKKEYL